MYGNGFEYPNQFFVKPNLVLGKRYWTTRLIEGNDAFQNQIFEFIVINYRAVLKKLNCLAACYQAIHLIYRHSTTTLGKS